MAELNRPCTYGGFSSIVNAALKRILFLYFTTVQSLELIIISYIKGKHALIILPTGHRKSLIYQAAPDIASESAARGLVSGKERAII